MTEEGARGSESATIQTKNGFLHSPEMNIIIVTQTTLATVSTGYCAERTYPFQPGLGALLIRQVLPMPRNTVHLDEQLPLYNR